MMLLSINCDRCLAYAERQTDYGAASAVIDSELEPGWVHRDGHDLCPACADALGVRSAPALAAA